MRFILFYFILFFHFHLISDEVKSQVQILFDEKKFEEAKILCEKNLKLNQKDSESLAILSLIHLKSKWKDFDKSESFIKRAIEIENKKSNLYLVYASILGAKISENGFSAILTSGLKIKNLILKAHELNPDDLNTIKAVFYFYLFTPSIVGGDKDKAIEIAQKLYKKDMYNGLILLATLDFKNEDESKGIENLKKAISISSNKPDAYRSLGMYYSRNKNYSLAKENILNLVKYDSLNPETFNLLGNANRNLKFYDESISNFKYALFLDKYNSNSIYGLAETYEEKKDFSHAIETYQWLIKNEKSGTFVKKSKEKLKNLEKKNGSN